MGQVQKKAEHRKYSEGLKPLSFILKHFEITKLMNKSFHEIPLNSKAENARVKQRVGENILIKTTAFSTKTTYPKATLATLHAGDAKWPQEVSGKFVQFYLLTPRKAFRFTPVNSRHIISFIHQDDLQSLFL